MGVHEDLVAARNLLDRSEWIRGRSVDLTPEGMGFCLVGAITAVVGDPFARDARTGLACTPLASILLRRDLTFTHLTTWNDNHARSKQDVLDLLDEAIALTAPEPEGVELGAGVSVPTPELEEIPIHA